MYIYSEHSKIKKNIFMFNSNIITYWVTIIIKEGGSGVAVSICAVSAGVLGSNPGRTGAVLSAKGGRSHCFTCIWEARSALRQARHLTLTPSDDERCRQVPQPQARGCLDSAAPTESRTRLFRGSLTLILSSIFAQIAFTI